MLKVVNINLSYTFTDQNIIDLIQSSKKDGLIEDMTSQVILVREYQKLGPTVCATLGDDTLCVGGVARLHSGLGVAWLIVNVLFLKYPKFMLKTSRQIVKEGFDHLKLHRIQMDIEAQYSENIRFAEKLGFWAEGIMHQYGPQKQDYIRYVCLRDSI